MLASVTTAATVVIYYIVCCQKLGWSQFYWKIGLGRWPGWVCIRQETRVRAPMTQPAQQRFAAHQGCLSRRGCCTGVNRRCGGCHLSLGLRCLLYRCGASSKPHSLQLHVLTMRCTCEFCVVCRDGVLEEGGASRCPQKHKGCALFSQKQKWSCFGVAQTVGRNTQRVNVSFFLCQSHTCTVSDPVTSRV